MQAGLIQLFDDAYGSFLVHSPFPLTALHVLAQAYETIESLQGAEIWQVMRVAPGTDSSSTITRGTRKALWYFEVFCAVFSSDRLVVCQPFGKAVWPMEDFELYNKMQEYSHGELNREEINDVGKVWDDLSTMLEIAYKSRLAQLFETE